MSAPDYETIFDIENAIEDACKAVLTQEMIPAYMQRETENLPDRRVDIQCLMGSHQGHRGKLPNGNHVRDAWNGTLTFNFWTPRFEVDGNKNPQPAEKLAHGRFRGKVRHAIEYFADRFTPSVLPYHVLTSIIQSGTDPQTAIDDAIDVSAIHFDIVVSVREGAWPVA